MDLINPLNMASVDRRRIVNFVNHTFLVLITFEEIIDESVLWLFYYTNSYNFLFIAYHFSTK